MLANESSVVEPNRKKHLPEQERAGLIHILHISDREAARILHASELMDKLR